VSNPPSQNDDPPSEAEKPEDSPEKNDQLKNRIVILEERDVPFQEERPPNFSPHFEVRVYKIRRSNVKEANET
jgi:hypothetical protein